MLDYALHRAPDSTIGDLGRDVVHSYTPLRSTLSMVPENLRHEFRNVETSFVILFSNGAALHSIWPASSDPSDPPDLRELAFFLESRPGIQVRTAQDVARYFPTIGIIPKLHPVDQDETARSAQTLSRNVSGRLASRHFKNHLRLLYEEREVRVQGRDPDDDEEWDDSEGVYEHWKNVCDWPDFVAFAAPWLGSFVITGVELSPGSPPIVNVYYSEAGTPEKELFWAGDGFHIWLQLLFHLFRLRESSIIVLDEPDSYLHPDLQRRLLGLLETLPSQAIFATHSVEIVGEAADDALVWIDRQRTAAVRVRDRATLSALAGTLGSRFNVGLARALRTNVVLCVEGDDSGILKRLARTLQASRVANEDGLAVLQIGGFENWTHIEPFSWLSQELLGDSVQCFEVLDRDYRSPDLIADVDRKLGEAGIVTHVWSRKELESFLVVPSAIARLSGADEGWIAETVNEITRGMHDHVLGRMVSSRQIARSKQGEDIATIAEKCSRELGAAWEDARSRLALCPAKTVLARLNEALQASGRSAVSVRALAGALQSDEIDREVREFLRRVEAALASTPCRMK